VQIAPRLAISLSEASTNVLTPPAAPALLWAPAGRAEEIGVSLVVFVVAETRRGSSWISPLISSFSSSAGLPSGVLVGFRWPAKQSPMAWIDDAASSIGQATARSRLPRGGGGKAWPRRSNCRHLANR